MNSHSGQEERFEWRRGGKVLESAMDSRGKTRAHHFGAPLVPDRGSWSYSITMRVLSIFILFYFILVDKMGCSAVAIHK